MSYALWMGSAVASAPAPLAVAAGPTRMRSAAAAHVRRPSPGVGTRCVRDTRATRQGVHSSPCGRPASRIATRHGRRHHAGLQRFSSTSTNHIQVSASSRDTGETTAGITAARHQAIAAAMPDAIHGINGGAVRAANAVTRVSPVPEHGTGDAIGSQPPAIRAGKQMKRPTGSWPPQTRDNPGGAR